MSSIKKNDLKAKLSSTKKLIFRGKKSNPIYSPLLLRSWAMGKVK